VHGGRQIAGEEKAEWEVVHAYLFKSAGSMKIRFTA
jgi:hypothetical protein